MTLYFTLVFTFPTYTTISGINSNRLFTFFSDLLLTQVFTTVCHLYYVMEIIRRTVGNVFVSLYLPLLAPWSRFLLEKLTGSQLLKKTPQPMEHDVSLPHSQVPATCAYHEILFTYIKTFSWNGN